MFRMSGQTTPTGKQVCVGDRNYCTVPLYLPSPVAGCAAGDDGQVLTLPRVSGVLCRGTRERRALDEALVNAWLSAFGAVAADPGAQVSAETLAGAV